MTSFKHRITSSRDRLTGLRHVVEDLSSKFTGMNDRLANIENTLRSMDERSRIKAHTIALSESVVLTKLFTDLKMYLNPSDMSVAAHIALDGIWEKEITRAWLAVLKRTDTVLDIGANFGYFSLLSGQFTDKKKARIVAFEANPKIIPYIEKSVSINWLNEQTTIENLAVSDSKGEVTLNVLEDYIGSSSLQSLSELDSYMHEKMRLKVRDQVKVASTTIDDYCRSHKINEVNLIKMDIEGHEEKAYSGMSKIIKSSKDITMFIEFTKDGYEHPEQFYNQMLSDFGHVYLIDEEGKLFKPKDNSYDSVIGNADDWVMPVFSKNKRLEESSNVVF